MMSETMHATTASSGRRAAPSARLRARAALSAEWIKLRSLRSMLVTLALAAVFCIGLAGSVCTNYVANWHTFDAADKAAFNPLDTNLNFLVVGVLFFGVLGALVVTNEYRNGLIRTTLAATPQRGLILAAKTALLVPLALLSSAVIIFAAFLTGQGILAGHVPHVTLADPGVLGRVLGAIFYLTAASLIGLFIGVLARSAAVAMTCVFGVFLVLPTLLDSLPNSDVWRHTVPYIPSNLGDALWLSHTGTGSLASPAVAALGLAAWVIVLGVLATYSLRRRDA
jgi:ABC-type transport system involved in multi-copper enzyme maturation permease subunit